MSESLYGCPQPGFHVRALGDVRAKLRALSGGPATGVPAMAVLAVAQLVAPLASRLVSQSRPFILLFVLAEVHTVTSAHKTAAALAAAQSGAAPQGLLRENPWAAAPLWMAAATGVAATSWAAATAWAAASQLAAATAWAVATSWTAAVAA